MKSDKYNSYAQMTNLFCILLFPSNAYKSTLVENVSSVPFGEIGKSIPNRKKKIIKIDNNNSINLFANYKYLT